MRNDKAWIDGDREPIGSGPEDFWLRKGRFSVGLMSKMLRKPVLERLGKAAHGNCCMESTWFFGVQTSVGVWIRVGKDQFDPVEFEIFIENPRGMEMSVFGPIRSSAMGWDQLVEELRLDASLLIREFKNEWSMEAYAQAQRERERRLIATSAGQAELKSQKPSL